MGDHGIGAIDLVRAILPEGLELAFVPITFLGDPWLLLIGLFVVFWLNDRRAGGAALGLAAAGAGVIIGLKAVFALERPSVGPPVAAETIPTIVRPLYHEVISPDSTAFPSGHAMGSTVAWVGGARVIPIGDRRLRYAVAGSVVTLVGISRVVIGVHFAADVVGGIVFGLAFVAGMLWLVERLPVDRWTGLFGLTLVAGVAGLWLTGGGTDAQLVTGAGLGGLATRYSSIAIPDRPWPVSPSGIALVGVGVAVLVGPVLGAVALGVPGGHLVGMGIGVAGALALPAGIEGLRTRARPRATHSESGEGD